MDMGWSAREALISFFVWRVIKYNQGCWLYTCNYNYYTCTSSTARREFGIIKGCLMAIT